MSARTWGANYFPNVVLTTHEGKPVRFYELIEGKTVAINFIYTSCGDICPAETAALLQVYQMLGEHAGRDVHLISISIDPDHDTPAKLNAYRQSFQIGRGWTFLTGSKEDVALIQTKLGIRINTPGVLASHSTTIMLGNESMQRWIKRSPYDNPLVLANLLTETLQPQERAVGVSGTRTDYTNAQTFPNMPRGEWVFRTRCVSCHSIGLGDKVGPDLAGVTMARSEDWMRKMIGAPDQLLASEDPIASSLFTRFRGVRMPNLRLGEEDLSAVIDYLKSEDVALRKPAEGASAPMNHQHHDMHHMH